MRRRIGLRDALKRFGGNGRRFDGWVVLVDGAPSGFLLRLVLVRFDTRKIGHEL